MHENVATILKRATKDFAKTSREGSLIYPFEGGVNILFGGGNSPLTIFFHAFSATFDEYLL
jgi:hypothetical protein